MPRIPDFFIVGQPKTGSTALYQMLSEHPDIFMSALKEPRFLEPLQANDWRRIPPPVQTLEDYLELFRGARADQIAGEASVAYLRAPDAPRNIARLNPDARIIVTLREPASLLRSWHAQLLRGGEETVSDLRAALAREEGWQRAASSRPVSGERRPPPYSEQVRYVDHLSRFRAEFPAEQMLVLIYDDYVKDSRQTLRRILEFLGVDVELAPEPATANVGHVVRFPAAVEALHRLSIGDGPVYGAGKQVIRTMTGPRLSRRMLNAAYRRSRGPVPLDEKLMTELRAKYAPEVRSLSDYLERDLTSLWLTTR